MADVNDKIVDALERHMRGEITLDEREGFCLGFVASALQAALGMPIPDFYANYVTKVADPVAHWQQDGPWARDAEKSLRDLGMGVHDEDAKPGDLFFIWKDAVAHGWTMPGGGVAYYGHVGILYTDALIVENVKPEYRPHSFHRGQVQLTPVNRWFRPSTIIRFDPEEKAGG